MSQLDALLERSKAPGQFVERKSFTLARSKAVEKMREFTLRHPRQYVLELVQAAVFGGAKWIAVDVRPNALLVGFIGGKTLQKDELGQLFDYLFVDQTELSTRHLMQLAVGVNAMLQRKPKVLRIESGNGKPHMTNRLDMTTGTGGKVGVAADPLSGTYIYAEFGTQWFSRFRASQKFESESQLVETRCVYTPAPILLNGRAPFGYSPSKQVHLFGVTGQVQFSEGQRWGAMGYVPRRAVAKEFRMVVGGVWISSRQLPQLGGDLAGVVSDPRLRKTADMSDIVEDDRFVHMLHALQPLATKILRAKKGKDHVPPTLPAKPKKKKKVSSDPRSVATVASEPLPPQIKMVSPRTGFHPFELPGVNDERPLFWMTEEDATSLAEFTDPLEFPYHVLILTPGQAVTLEEWADKKAAQRLTTREDVAFVRRALMRGAQVETVRDRCVDAGISDGPLEFQLRLHQGGRTPDWGTQQSGVPCLVQVGEKTERLLRLPVELPNVSIVVSLKAGRTLASNAETYITSLVVRESWRLLSVNMETQAESVTGLTSALLGLHVRPFFVRDGTDITLELRFPTQWWADRIDSVKQVTLGQTTEGPLTLARFGALQGTEGVVILAEGEDISRLRTLESRFGWGHVCSSDLRRSPLAGWLCVEGFWQPMTARAVDASVQAVLMLNASLASSVGPGDAFRSVPMNSPLWSLWIRGEVSDAIIEEGLETALNALIVLHRERDVSQAAPGERVGMLQSPTGSGWPTLAKGAIHADRARGVGRLGLMHLARRLGRLERLKLSCTDGKRHRVDEILAGTISVAPLQGPVVHEGGVVQLTLDEVQALKALDEHSELTLYADDAPDIWRSLTSPEPSQWLVTREVLVPGLEGWLGLRFPFDATPNLLLETCRQAFLLPQLSPRIPCHGLLRTTGGFESLTDGQRHLLSLAATQLFQDLLEMLHTEMSAERQDAARQYAMRYAAWTWVLDGHLSTSTAQQLADKVPVWTDSGETWGTLADWFRAASERRPPIAVEPLNDLETAREAFGIQTGPFPAELDDKESPSSGSGGSQREVEPPDGEYRDCAKWVLRHMRAAWMAVGVHAPLQVHLVSSARWYKLRTHSVVPVRISGMDISCVVELDQEHPLVLSATHGNSRAMTLLLLEVANVAGAWLEAQGDRDLVQSLHQYLMAQRVIQAG